MSFGSLPDFRFSCKSAFKGKELSAEERERESFRGGAHTLDRVRLFELCSLFYFG